MLQEIPNVFDDYEKKIYRLPNGEYILIEMDCNTTSVYLINKPIKDHEELGYIGSFEFGMEDEERGGTTISRSKVLQMDLSGLDKKYLRKGIGSEIIRLKEELEGEYVAFGERDGSRNSDGSYLIDDGPGFAKAIYDKR
ncbi:hypothetical protein [Vreelandella neptunia]|uniref:N-acetyltransferase domain-containing protein n=1 Tax=Vreelandella neptunia TaxID=115551 RepID=A0ABS9S105_9GAMM|nr:hypothetical protein [Halomonas neptunia]MCH4809786.1 hypothetical protein [Halomonas neptunia]